MTDRAYNLWNSIEPKFAPEDHQGDHDEVKEIKQDDKQKDMHYHIKQMECQMESLLKQQKLFVEVMRRNYRAMNCTTTHTNTHSNNYCIIVNSVIIVLNVMYCVLQCVLLCIVLDDSMFL